MASLAAPRTAAVLVLLALVGLWHLAARACGYKVLPMYQRSACGSQVHQLAYITEHERTPSSPIPRVTKVSSAEPKATSGRGGEIFSVSADFCIALYPRFPTQIPWLFLLAGTTNSLPRPPTAPRMDP